MLNWIKELWNKLLPPAPEYPKAHFFHHNHGSSQPAGEAQVGKRDA